MEHVNLEYDVFLSYARADGSDVADLVRELERIFRSHAGQPLRMFIDTKDVGVGQQWERRILGALERSAVMIAVLTPSYLTSEWCRREWDRFCDLERERCEALGRAASYQRLIFPVVVQALDRLLRPSSEARRVHREAAARQYVDLTGVQPDDPQFRRLVGRLVDDIIAVIAELHADGYRHADDQYDRGDSPEIVIRNGRSSSDEFVQLLSEAEDVITIGITNENLAGFLEQALARKRAADSRAFWRSLRVVFLSEKPLHLVNDELVALYSDTGKAAENRARNAGFGKRAVVSFLLRAGQPERWWTYEYPYVPPFIGAVLGMPDGRKVIQLAHPRPRLRMWDLLFFQFIDVADQYFEQAFKEVVQDSIEQNEVILVGKPVNHGVEFRCRGANFRKGVLLGGNETTDWLPAVIVATWQRVGDSAVPLLQINTKQNSTRELGKASHLSGYVNLQDYVDSGDAGVGTKTISEFDMSLSVAENAVRRELREELRVESGTLQPRLDCTLRFIYHDKENLFFYLFELELPATASDGFPPNSEIHTWTIEQLLQARDHHVLYNTQRLLRRKDLSPTQLEQAAELLRLNLILHGRKELGQRLGEEVQQPNGGFADLEARVAELVRETRQQRRSHAGQPLALDGLAGLQYREFFSAMLPLYAGIGVPGAAERLARLAGDPVTSEAIKDLARRYADEEVMSTLPIEV
jgi:hypothetical protein